MRVRIITRVITYDSGNRRILLVKNRGQDFWYPPGGGWDHEKENIMDCATREVYEETGLKVKVLRLLYLQEFHENDVQTSFETMWLAKPSEGTNLNELHVDHDVDGKVEKARWFSREELKHITIFPKRLQGSFWENIERFLKEEDPFIGVS